MPASFAQTRVLSSFRLIACASASALLAISGSTRLLFAQRKAATPPGPAGAALVDSAKTKALTWRYIGPEGNRITSTSGVPGDPNTLYAGAASGGLWKSSDGGAYWKPIFDDQTVSSIGSITVANSDHNVVWVGTGEPFIRSHISIGWGVFKSTDAGKHWLKMGLENTGRISRIVVHPTNPDIVYVASLGTAYGPQQERGIYRTMDGGTTWTRVLFVNDSTGASDLVMDPNNPRILFAAFWQIDVKTWGRTSGGAGSGIWTSRDGGTTWSRVTAHGLPTAPVGKIGLAMSKANSDRVYALIETGDGVPAVNIDKPDAGRLWRSDDGGVSWKKVSDDRQVAGRTHYYNRMAAMPDNADEAYFATADWAKTLDGGATIIDPPPQSIPMGDHHDIWIDPTEPSRMMVSHDDGLSVSTNRGRTWRVYKFPVAQIYHVTVDDRIPYFVYGNRQDGPSWRGPSNTRYTISFTGNGHDIPREAWQTVGGGESGFATPDMSDTNFVWSSASGSGAVGGIVTRHDLRSGLTRAVEVWPDATLGHAAADVKYRFQWNFPLHVSPHDPKTVYVGSQHVHVTHDYGQTWQLFSPDLTRNDRTRMNASGGLTPDNIGVEYAGVIMWINESPIERGVVWAGTNDGRVQLTRDNGKTWNDVSKNIPNLLDWGTVSAIVSSRYSAGTAYISVDGHQVNNRDPFIYKTTDFGATWTMIVNGIAKSPLSYVHTLAEDPKRQGLLFAGTENGAYVSLDDGARWQSLQNNLPHVPVYGMVVQPRFGDLVIATYGRGFWILDDISPLRDAVAVASEPVSLFTPRNAYRFRDAEAPYSLPNDPTAGSNPAYGATLHYWLKDDARDTVKIEMTNSVGAIVRTLKSVGKAGINRVQWDLRGEPTKEARLRVSPYLAPWSAVGPDGKVAPGLAPLSLLQLPGVYTVRLSAAGITTSASLTVLPDPFSRASAAELAAQDVFTRSLYTQIDSAVSTINRVELTRAQLAAAKAALAADPKTADLKAATDSVDLKLVALEELLHQVRITGRGQDALRWPAGIAQKLVYLAGTVAGSDDRPTASADEVRVQLGEKLRDATAKIDQLMNGELDALRKRIRARTGTLIF